MLILEKISKIYHNVEGDFKALKSIDLKFPSQGICVIEGNSGSGKTTLLNIIAGIDNEFTGQVIYNGKKILKKEADYYRSKHIAFSSQFFGLLEMFTVKENLMFACEFCGESYSDDLAYEILRKVNLPDSGEQIDAFLKKRANELSGGQKQRLSIARAIIKKAEILVLDEPTSSIDEYNRNIILSTLLEYSKHSLVIIASHDAELLRQEAALVVHIEDGAIASLYEKNTINIDTNIAPKVIRKSSFSLKNIFLFSYRTYKNDWIKTIFSMFLIVLSVLFFSISMMIYHADSNIANIRSMMTQDSRFGFLYSYEMNDKMGYDDKEISPFNEREINIISGHSEFYPVSTFNLSFCFDPDLWTVWNTNEALLFSKEANLIDVSKETKLENLGLSVSELCPNEGRLPQNNNEIALTDFMASIIVNHQNNFPGIKFDSPVKNIEDLIGKKMTIALEGIFSIFENKTITGVFACDDLSCSSLLANDFPFNKKLINDGISREILSAKCAGNSIIKSIFICDNNTSFSKVLTRFSSNMTKEVEFMNKLNDEPGRIIELVNKHSGISKYVDSMSRWIGYFSLIIGFTFGIVSFLLIIKDIVERTHINNKNIGILKSMGALNKDVLGVTMMHNIPYYAITGLFTVALTFISSILINFLISLEYLVISPLFIIISMLVFAFIGAFVSLFESIKVSKINIANIIKLNS